MTRRVAGGVPDLHVDVGEPKDIAVLDRAQILHGFQRVGEPIASPCHRIREREGVRGMTEHGDPVPGEDARGARVIQMGVREEHGGGVLPAASSNAWTASGSKPGSTTIA